MRTAIVILNWNGRNWLERFLPAVLHHSAGADVIVADNASTDGSMEWLREQGVATIALDRNFGFAGGYNEALRRIKADRYVLLNSDVEVTPGWLAGMHALLDRHPRMAACQPKILSHVASARVIEDSVQGNRRSVTFSATPRFEHAGAAGGFIDRNGYPFCRGRIFEVTEEDRGQYDDEREVFWATGACMMVRSDAFHAAGGFDHHLFAHMEEIDLCWRLRRMGWSIGYTSRSRVYHVGGGALGYGSPRKTYLNFRNSLIVLTKNLRSTFWPVSLFRRLVLDGFAAIKFLLEGHGIHAWQVWRAHWSYFASLGRVLGQRRALKKMETGADLTGIYDRSIAFDRFILGWKTFTQLDPSAFRSYAPTGTARPAHSPAHPAP